MTADELRQASGNPASDLIHMSGECLCGSFAAPGEREEIEAWFPLAFDQIRELEAAIADRHDIPEVRKTWGWGADPAKRALDRAPSASGRLFLRRPVADRTRPGWCGMTADELRQASGEMRRLAEAATAINSVSGKPVPWHDAGEWAAEGFDREDAEHICAWSPAVALAVADSLIVAAVHIESHECEAHCEQGGCDLVLAAQRTARAFLGTTP